MLYSISWAHAIPFLYSLRPGSRFDGGGLRVDVTWQVSTYPAARTIIEMQLQQALERATALQSWLSSKGSWERDIYNKDC